MSTKKKVFSRRKKICSTGKYWDCVVLCFHYVKHWMYWQPEGIHLFPASSPGQTISVFLYNCSNLPPLFPSPISFLFQWIWNPPNTATISHAAQSESREPWTQSPAKAQVEQDVLCPKFTSAHGFRLLRHLARSGFSFLRGEKLLDMPHIFPQWVPWRSEGYTDTAE